MQSTDEQVRAAAAALAEHLAAFCKEMLGADFIGFYLLGSLAHGGFNRRYSDIDLALISETGMNQSQCEACDQAALRFSPSLAGRVSLFWSDRNFTVGRFPPLDRIDYIDHGVALAERERVVIEKPALVDVRNYLSGTPFDQWAARGTLFSTQATLDPHDRKTFLKTQLYPARFAYSWLTGQIASNDDAIAYLQDHPPPGLDLALIGRALNCRHQAADPDCLFADRRSLPKQYAACAQLMTA